MGTCRIARRAVPWIAVAGLLLAAPATTPADEPKDGGELRLEIGDPASVADLLKEVSKVTGATIVWQDGDKVLERRIRIVGGAFVAPAGRVFDVVRAVLATQEIAMLSLGPKGNSFWYVVDARMSTGMLRLKATPVEMNDATAAEYESLEGYFVSATISVKNLQDLGSARQALTRMITQQNIGSVTEVPAARAFLVTDFAPNVVAIYRQIKAMDVPPVPRVRPEKFVLAHAKAEAVAAILTDLFASRRRAAAGEGKAPAPQSADADGNPGIAPDAATNQVIVLGTEADITAIRTVVSYLDQAAGGPK